MAWGVEGFVVSFIAPHSLTARALVVAPDDVLTVHNRSRDAGRHLASTAGPAGELGPGEAIDGALPARGGRPGAGAGVVVLPAAAREVRAVGEVGPGTSQIACAGRPGRNIVGRRPIPSASDGRTCDVVRSPSASEGRPDEIIVRRSPTPATEASDRRHDRAPGPLTDDPGTGTVATRPTARARRRPRDDVAAVARRVARRARGRSASVRRRVGDTRSPTALSPL